MGRPVIFPPATSDLYTLLVRRLSPFALHFQISLKSLSSLRYLFSFHNSSLLSFSFLILSNLIISHQFLSHFFITLNSFRF